MWFLNRKKRILIVEDDDVARALAVRRINNMKKYTSFEATNIAEAISVIETGQPDFLLLDLILNGENGFYLLEMMNDKKLPHIPTFITTNDQKLGTIEDALRLGALDYIVKPYDSATLSTKLASYKN